MKPPPPLPYRERVAIRAAVQKLIDGLNSGDLKPSEFILTRELIEWFRRYKEDQLKLLKEKTSGKDQYQTE